MVPKTVQKMVPKKGPNKKSQNKVPKKGLKKRSQKKSQKRSQTKGHKKKVTKKKSKKRSTKKVTKNIKKGKKRPKKVLDCLIRHDMLHYLLSLVALDHRVQWSLHGQFTLEIFSSAQPSESSTSSLQPPSVLSVTRVYTSSTFGRPTIAAADFLSHTNITTPNNHTNPTT